MTRKQNLHREKGQLQLKQPFLWLSDAFCQVDLETSCLGLAVASLHAFVSA